MFWCNHLQTMNGICSKKKEYQWYYCYSLSILWWMSSLQLSTPSVSCCPCGSHRPANKMRDHLWLVIARSLQSLTGQHKFTYKALPSQLFVLHKFHSTSLLIATPWLFRKKNIYGTINDKYMKSYKNDINMSCQLIYI